MEERVIGQGSKCEQGLGFPRDQDEAAGQNLEPRLGHKLELIPKIVDVEAAPKPLPLFFTACLTTSFATCPVVKGLERISGCSLRKMSTSHWRLRAHCVVETRQERTGGVRQNSV